MVLPVVEFEHFPVAVRLQRSIVIGQIRQRVAHDAPPRLQAGARWRRRSTPPPAAVGGGHPNLSVPEARRQPSTTGSDPPSPNMTPSLIRTGSYRRRTRRSLSERVALLCDAGEELVP